MRQIEKTTQLGLEFPNDCNSKKYKIKAICNSIIYTIKLKVYLPGLWYLVPQKNYPQKENT